jgi:tRNA threonylcarbamoyl adenosine modification protein YeaZ
MPPQYIGSSFYTPVMAGAADGSLVLALDTGSPLVSVALGRGGRVVAARAAAMERSSSQLLALAGEVLGAAGVRPAELAGVVALAGPGSFTGLRIGLATALGLHQALGLAALALPTLRVLAAEAAEAAPGRGLVIAAVDALRGEWSAQPFTRAALPEPRGEMELVAAADLVREAGGENGALVTGFGISRLAAAGEAASAPQVGTAREAGLEAGFAAEAGTAREAALEAGFAAEVGTAREAALKAGITAEVGTAGEAGLEAGFGTAEAAGAARTSIVRLREPGPLAPVALRLAAATPLALWDAATLVSPLYARPPAVTLPRRRGVGGAGS